MCRSFQNLTVKTALKSVDFDKVTDKNKLAPFLWPTVYNAHSNWQEHIITCCRDSPLKLTAKSKSK